MFLWGPMCQKQVFKTWISNYTLHIIVLDITANGERWHGFLVQYVSVYGASVGIGTPLMCVT